MTWNKPNPKGFWKIMFFDDFNGKSQRLFIVSMYGNSEIFCLTPQILADSAETNPSLPGSPEAGNVVPVKRRLKNCYQKN